MSANQQEPQQTITPQDIAVLINIAAAGIQVNTCRVFLKWAMKHVVARERLQERISTSWATSNTDQISPSDQSELDFLNKEWEKVKRGETMEGADEILDGRMKQMAVNAMARVEGGSATNQDKNLAWMDVSWAVVKSQKFAETIEALVLHPGGAAAESQ